MATQPDNSRYVRQIVLPSGRTIDVVYFDDRARAPLSPRPGRVSHLAAELNLCQTCGSRLVYPVEWAESGSTHWRVCRRCPDCEWTGSDVYEQAVVERFDVELDRATESLLEDLQRLARANMEEDVERFAAALLSGHIFPCDF